MTDGNPPLNVERGLKLLKERGYVKSHDNGRHYVTPHFYFVLGAVVTDYERITGKSAIQVGLENRTDVLMKTLLYGGPATKEDLYHMSNVLLTMLGTTG